MREGWKKRCVCSKILNYCTFSLATKEKIRTFFFFLSLSLFKVLFYRKDAKVFFQLPEKKQKREREENGTQKGKEKGLKIKNS